MQKSSLIILASLTLAGCVTVVDARDTDQNRTLVTFDKVQASRGVEVSLRCGAEPSARLKGDERDLANTEMSVEGGALIVRRDSLIGGYRHAVHVEVTVPWSLARLSAASGATIEAPACLISHERLDLAASSGAAIHLAADVRRLSVDTGSGASIRPLQGGRIDAADAEIDASSGSSVRVCTVSRMQANASSGADITAESIGAGDSRTSFGGGVSLRRCE